MVDHVSEWMSRVLHRRPAALAAAPASAISDPNPRDARLVSRIVEAARFTRAPILLIGESGTGKELLARLVHILDGRALAQRQEGRDLITLDCTTIVPELSGSELFGHERGAFTGAATARDGVFALANQGTLFLDEVG